MHLVQVQGAIKGRRINYNLGKLTLITGPNFSGKTAIFDAIRFALSGKIPGGPGTNTALCEKFGDRGTLEGVVTTDTGQSFQHAITGSKVLRAEGLEEELPLLSPSNYFSLSEAERNAYLFRQVRLPETFSKEGIIARLQRLTFGEEHTEAIQKAKAEILSKHVEPVFFGKFVQDAVMEAIETLRPLYTSANSAAKDTIGAVRTMAELRHREGECSAETLQGLDDQIKEVMGKRDHLRDQISAQNERKAARAKESEGRKSIEAQIASLRAALEKPEEEIKGPTEETITAAKKEWAEFAVPATPTEEDITKAGADLREIEQTLLSERRNFTNSLKSLDEIEKQIGDIESAEHCPTCLAKGKNWKAGISKTLLAEKKRIEGVRDGIHERVTELERKYAQADRKLFDLRTGMKTVNKLAEQKRQLETRLTLLRHDLEVLDTKRQAAKDKREGSRRQLTALEEMAANFTPLESEVDQDFDPEIHAIHSELNTLQAKRDAALKLRNDLARSAQAEAIHLGYAAKRDVIKKVGEELKEIRGEMANDAFSSLVTVANQIAHLNTPLAVHDGEIGRWEGSTFITHHSMSGVEKLITFVATAAALSQGKPLRLVLMDELGNADALQQNNILLRLEAAVDAGIIDQALVIIPSANPNLSSSPVKWNIINTK